jgi:diketogulonate reductase-like aldo/keto reductase
MEFITLNNGVKMPQEGFGVFQVPDLVECEQAVLNAIEAGYRLIDTAAVYMNETAVGKTLKKCGVPRDELFITSKLWVQQDGGYENTRKAFQASLDKLGIEYLDLYLIHWPYNDYYGSWRAMEELYEEGRVRAIGVCNFYPERLTDFCLNVNVIPAVNQVECHPFFQRIKDMECMKEYDIQIEAWGPLAEGGHGIFTHPVLTTIGKKYGKTAAQVALRWNVQRGVVIIPKSVHKERIEQNFAIWDFSLSEDDMQKISKLDVGHSEISHLYDPDFIKWLNSVKAHE